MHVPGKRLKSPLTQAAEVSYDSDTRLHVCDKRTRVRFLVDTGSVFSLLPRVAYQRAVQRQPLTLHAANRTEIATYGDITMDLHIGLRRDLPCKLIIADVPHAILGADFLTEHRLLVDVGGKKLLDTLTGLSTTGSLGQAPVHSVTTIESLDHPDSQFTHRYSALLEEFADVFEPSSGPVQPPGLPVKHSIVTTGPPVVERPRRLVGERLSAAKQVFADLLEQGIIRPSNSQWASPLHLVPKKDGSWRVTGDYRRLNACTIPDRYPLPIIEDLLQESQGNVFSTVDLQKAFYQIPIAQEDIEKTAVTTPFGLYEFLGTSLGLRNAAQSMQRTMDHVLRKLPFVKVYIDDLFVASSSHEEHLDHLRQLFETLRAANLKINRGKCTFGKPQVLYLGYLVSQHGFQPPPSRVEAIKLYPRPEATTQLRSFLGILNSYNFV